MDVNSNLGVAGDDIARGIGEAAHNIAVGTLLDDDAVVVGERSGAAAVETYIIAFDDVGAHIHAVHDDSGVGVAR